MLWSVSSVFPGQVEALSIMLAGPKLSTTLLKSKEETERALAATILPLEVTAECMNLGEGYRGKELVSDPVEAELKKEVEVIDGAQRALQQCIDQAFEQL
ncbi:hypothetical protein cypCar_00007878 [Cyprinus carpio]|nr:hypothetical protein cypCar_00007878 [Cyprinus carpio]